MPEVLDLDPIQKSIEKHKTDTDEAMKGYKKATDDLLEQFKDQARTDFATKGVVKEMEDKFNDKLKEVNAYVEAIEKSAKAKKLTADEQVSFDAILSKSIDDNLTEIQSFASPQKGHSFKLNIAQKAADMGLNVSVTNGPGAYFTTVIPALKTIPNRRTHMRDIIPLGVMSTNSLTYMRETGTDGLPTTWAENSGEKPQVDSRFEEVTVKAQWIAAWLRISRTMLDDMPALRSYLQMRLLEMYLLVEDAQTLNGDGTGSNLEGIMTVATDAIVTTGANIERLIWALAQLAQKNFYGNGIVVNPSAYYAIALNKATGSGEYDLPGIVVVNNGQLYVAGVPVYMTTAMESNEYLVGDWMLGAQLFIREQPVVEFFDQDGDNVRTNRITVRIEGRVALAIPYPEAFVKGTFENIPVFPGSVIS